MEKNIKREGLIIKKEGKEGPKGNFALPLPPADRKTGGRSAAALDRRPWGLVGAWEVGERERESRWVVSPFLIWTEVERGGWHTAAGGGEWRRLWWR